MNASGPAKHQASGKWKGYNSRPFSESRGSPRQKSNQSQTSSTHSGVNQTLALVPQSSHNEDSNRDMTAQQRQLALNPFIHSLSPSKTGCGVITRFTSTEATTGVARLGHCDMSRTKGTGPHDDAMARDRPNYRGPSLRRGSGFVVETPKEIRKEISKRQMNSTWNTAPQQDGQDESQAANTTKAPRRSQRLSNIMGGINHQIRGDCRSDMSWSRGRINAPRVRSEGHVIFTGVEKLTVIGNCMERKDEYLALPLRGKAAEKNFWEAMFKSQTFDLQVKLETGVNLKVAVNNWCQSRRQLFCNGTIPPPNDEVEEAIDNWLLVWARRYCQLNRGLIEKGISPVVEKKIVSVVRKELSDIIQGLLRERKEELARLTRPVTLPAPTNFEEYSQLVQVLEGKVAARGIQSHQVRQTEALASLIFDIQPGLEQEILQEMGLVDSIADAPVQRVESSGSINAGSDDEKDNASERDEAPSEDEVAGVVDGLGHRSEMDRVVLPSIEGRTPPTSPGLSSELQRYEEEYRRLFESATKENSRADGKRQRPSERKRKANASAGDGVERDVKRLHRLSQQPERPSSHAVEASTVTRTMALPTRIKSRMSPGAQPISTPSKGSAMSPLVIGDTPLQPKERPSRARNLQGTSRKPDIPGPLQSPPSSSNLFRRPQTPHYQRETTVDFQAMSPGAKELWLYKSIQDLKKLRDGGN